MNSIPTANGSTSRVSETVRAVDAMASDFWDHHAAKRDVPVMTPDEMRHLQSAGLIAYRYDGEAKCNGKGYVKKPKIGPAQARVDDAKFDADIEREFRLREKGLSP